MAGIAGSGLCLAGPLSDWETQDASILVQRMAADKEAGILIAGGNLPGVYIRSVDRGETWTDYEFESAIVPLAIGDGNGTFLVVASRSPNGTTFHSSGDGGLTFDQSGPINDEVHTLHGVVWDSVNQRWIIVGSTIFRSLEADPSKGWEKLIDDRISPELFAIDGADGQFAAGGDGNLYIAEDGGSSWRQVTEGVPASLRAIHFDGNTWYLGGNNGLFTSVNLEAFAPVTLSPPGAIHTIDSNGLVYSAAGISSVHNYCSIGGDTWDQHSRGEDITALKIIGNQVVAVGRRVIYRATIDAQITVTIDSVALRDIDEDDAPSIEIRATRGTKLLSNEITIPILYGGTATRGTDFNAPDEVTFPAGTARVVFNVDILDDAMSEPDESIRVNVTESDLVAVGNPDGATINVRDSDPDGTSVGIRFRDGDPPSSIEGGRSSQIVLFRTGVTSGNLTVDLAISGDAENGVDFETIPETIGFQAGETEKAYDLIAIDDGIPERTLSGQTLQDETAIFRVIPNAAYSADRNRGSLEALIADDDWRLLFIQDSQDASEGTNGTLTLGWNAQWMPDNPADAFPIQLDADSTATHGEDFILLEPGGNPVPRVGGNRFMIPSSMEPGGGPLVLTVVPQGEPIGKEARFRVVADPANGLFPDFEFDTGVVRLGSAPPVLPAAYWRLNEKPAGQSVSANNVGGDRRFDDTVIDSSPNENHMRTFSIGTSPRYVTDAPESSVPQTGEPNRLSLIFGLDRDGPNGPDANDDIYTSPGSALDNHRFPALTVEAVFKLTQLGRWQSVIGKDGKPTSNAISPFQLKVNANNRLWAEVLDGSGRGVMVQSRAALAANRWYYAAVVSDGRTLALYLKSSTETDYRLQGSQPVSGALYNSRGTWTIGRGFFNDRITDWLVGRVNEVRIHDQNLEPDQFLGSEAETVDPRIVVTISGNPPPANEDAMLVAELTATRSDNGTNGPLIVPLVYGGNATAGTDYSGPTQITFPAGSTEIPFQISILNDDVPEPRKTINVNIAGTDLLTVGNPAGVTITILDSDVIPEKPTFNIVVVQGELDGAAEDGRTTKFIIFRRGNTAAAFAGRVDVQLAITGTAVNGVDFERLPETVVFEQDQTEAELTVIAIDDDLPERARAADDSFIEETASVALVASDDYEIHNRENSIDLILWDDDYRVLGFANRVHGLAGQPGGVAIEWRSAPQPDHAISAFGIQLMPESSGTYGESYSVRVDGGDPLELLAGGQFSIPETLSAGGDPVNLTLQPDPEIERERVVLELVPDPPNGLFVDPGASRISIDIRTTPIGANSLPADWEVIGDFQFSELEYGNGQWMALGRIPFGSPVSPLALSLDDAETWWPIEIGPAIGQELMFERIEYGNGTWVAVGRGIRAPSSIVFTSRDGFEWVRIDPEYEPIRVLDLAYVDDSWLLTGSRFRIETGETFVAIRTPDFRTGTEADLGFEVSDFQHGDGRFASGTSWSLDGLNWTRGPFIQDLHGTPAYGEGLWVTTGRSNSIFSTTDFINWERGFYDPTGLGTPVGIGNFRYGGGRWVGVGSETGVFESGFEPLGVIGGSNDGTTWGVRATRTRGSLNVLEYGDGQWLAAGPLETLLRSSDGGEKWEALTAAAGGSPEMVKVGDRWIIDGNVADPDKNFHVWAVLESNVKNIRIQHRVDGLTVGLVAGDVYTSTDHLRWERRWESFVIPETNTTLAAGDVAHDGNQWVVVGRGGLVLTSPDGINWTQRESGTNQQIRKVHHADGRWIALIGAQEILTSVNGIDWSLLEISPDPTTQSFLIDHDRGLWIIVGGIHDENVIEIHTSVDGLHWETGLIEDFIGSPESLTHGDGTWVIGTSFTTLFSSQDGFEWTRRDLLYSADWIFADGNWIGFGNGVHIPIEPSNRLIIQHPRSLSVRPGSSTVEMKVRGLGENLTFQWFFNDMVIAGAVDPTLRIVPQIESIGAYHVEVSNGESIETSRPAYFQLSDDPLGPIAVDDFADLFVSAGPSVRPVMQQEPGDRIPRPSQNSVASGSIGTQIFSTFGATSEIGEPAHCGLASAASYWFAYQAPRDGQLTIDTDGSDFDTVLAVYLSSDGNLLNLEAVVCDNDNGTDGADSTVTFQAAAGTIYYVAVNGVDGATGVVQLNYAMANRLEFLNPALSTESGFTVQLLVPPNQGFVIEMSRDLKTWENLSTHEADESGAFDFVAPDPATGGSMFFRATLPE